MRTRRPPDPWTTTPLPLQLFLSPIQPYHQLEPEPLPTPDVLRPRIDGMLALREPAQGAFIGNLVALDFESGSRSERYQKQAWGPLGPVLILHSALGQERYLRIARHYASQWIEAVWTRDAAAVGGAAPHLEAPGHFAWYDMAVGQRAARLGYLLDRLARASRCGETLVAKLIQVLETHLAFLAEPTNLARHSNHGLFQALCLLSVCRRFSETPWIAARLPVAKAMFAEMLDRQFHADAVHREHSPGYHAFVLTVLRAALDAGVVERADFPEGFLARAEEALAWMVTPDGRLLAFGDTDPIPAAKMLDRVSWETPDFARRMRLGWRERSDPLGARRYDDAGLAAIRAAAFDGERSYLAFNAGFHSRVHKHADHLGLAWFEGRDAILADPGRFGYFGRTDPGGPEFAAGFWYGDPRRIYVESTRSHNCVEIDGTSHARRRTPFFGSALTLLEEADGIHFVRGEVRHREVRHARTLLLRPGRWLIALDWLFDRRDVAHDFVQWFKFGPRCAVTVDNGEPASGERPVFVSQIIDQGEASLVTGRSEPELRGWISERAGSLTPAPSLRLAYPDRHLARIGTLIAVDRPARVTASSLNMTMTAGWIDVADGDGIERVPLAISSSAKARRSAC